MLISRCVVTFETANAAKLFGLNSMLREKFSSSVLIIYKYTLSIVC
jgi:hypothetical protein